MTPRHSRATWVLLAALAGVYVAGEVLLAAAGGTGDTESPLVAVAFTAMAVVYLAVGGLIVTRLPTNSVGWLLCGAGFFLGLTSITYGYAALVLDPTTGNGRRTGVAAAWVSSWSWAPPLVGVPPLLFLLFPNGRTLGPLWRWVGGLAVAGLGCVVVAAALTTGPLTNSSVPAVTNPAALLPRGLADRVTLTGFTLSVLAVVLAACSLIVRLRRSRGVERQQFKWLMWSAGLLPVYLALGTAQSVFGKASGGVLVDLLLALCLSVVPLAVGAAIMRYRLYDIDLVINRTLVYGALTATLAAAYLACVLVLRLALDPVTGGSDLTVAASTLAVAALFRPLRNRIQSAVDRRFYRDRYDAARALEAFAAHLSDELDLETLQHDLRRVILDTVHPTHVTLWLRETAR